MGELSIVSMVVKAAGYLGCLALAAFFVRLYQIRIMFRRAARDYGAPMMPHSFLLGHLWTIGKAVMKRKLPVDLIEHWNIKVLKEEFPELAKHGLLYMDVWPIGYPMVAVFDPDMAAQFTQEQNQPKFWAQGEVEFKPFSGGKDLVHLEGQEWKNTRALFNPGFSAKNMQSLVPLFIEDVMVFRQRLRDAASSKNTVKLEGLTTPLTVDVMGRAVLGEPLNTQSRESIIATTMDKQLGLLYFSLDLRKQLSPLRPLRHWWYNRVMRRELMPMIQRRVADHDVKQGPKTVLGLAIKEYVAGGAKADAGLSSIPPAFYEGLINNLKIFMFAGHDTTASTMAYIFYLLSKNPDKAARVRAEHDSVLGTDRSRAPALLSADPNLLNRLPYTLAVLRETLRMFPPVGGTIRQTAPGFLLTHPRTGQRYPTHGFMVHDSASTTMRDGEYWPEPDCFIPERWLAPETHADEETHRFFPPRRDAWRPFEMGPRNCIGQELVSFEVRLVLALTVRDFDVREQYPDNAPTWFGDRAYQVTDQWKAPTGHVKEGLPVKVVALP